MRKKGVSPVIATVLLISIVVIIGLIIFAWFRAMVTEAILKFDDENIELACDKVDFGTSYSGGQLQVSNNGNVPIYKLKIGIYKEGSHEIKDITSLATTWPSHGLNQGAGFSEIISFTDVQKITVIPVLIGTSKKGRQTYTCKEKQHGVELLLQ
jgi:FlaG/FlaF family flagellin (archaellin)